MTGTEIFFAALTAFVSTTLGLIAWLSYKASDRSATAAATSARAAEEQTGVAKQALEVATQSAEAAAKSANAADLSAMTQREALTIELERRGDETRADLVARRWSGKSGLIVANVGLGAARNVQAYRLWNDDMHFEATIGPGSEIQMRDQWTAAGPDESPPPGGDELEMDFDPERSAYFFVAWEDPSGGLRNTGWKLILRT